MAKYKTSGLISEIRGSMGDKTFSYWKGVPVVKKKMKKKKWVSSVVRARRKEVFAFLAESWTLMSSKDQALWGIYAKQDRKVKSKSRLGLISTIGNWYSPRITFMSVNQLLMISGFSPLQRPLFGKLQPPLPATDLPEYSEWDKDIKFKIWLPRQYKDRCAAQIWIRKASGRGGNPYITKVVPLSTSLAEVKLKEIKFYEKKGRLPGKTVKKDLSEMGYCKLKLQMRTVAENGRFSMPSGIYKIELGRTQAPNEEVFSNKRITEFLNNLPVL
ncbi:hypothetical protein KAW50_03035 [candidate division WOR-3 bacterium]|nr:hypothetical protein [candidate division WOR-3 bacterium]